MSPRKTKYMPGVAEDSGGSEDSHHGENSNPWGGDGGGMLRLLVKWAVIPYVIGCLLSEFVPHKMTQTTVQAILTSSLSLLTQEKNGSSGVFVAADVENNEEGDSTGKANHRSMKEGETRMCWERFVQAMNEEASPMLQELIEKEGDGEGVRVVLHRNGDVEGCGVSLNFLSELRDKLNGSGDDCPLAFNKYEVESLLTGLFHHSMKSCTSVEPDRTEDEGFLGFCDMGEDKTPILLDHDKLVPVVNSSGGDADDAYLPCHFHSREGVRVTSFLKFVSAMMEEYKKTHPQQDCHSNNIDGEGDQVCNNNPKNEIHVYAVPAGRVFMFAPSFVGEIFYLPHIEGADPTKPVYIKVLSLSPRVFDIFNYFTKEESDGLVAKAMAEKSESHRIKRSSTGASGYNINTRRTSESGFDTHGSIAQAVKRRCFSVLGFDEYIESHSDGLQILRYNQTKAYTAHLDWIDDDGQQEHNYDSAGKGGNRFATILLYMTDLSEGEGGETVFVKAAGKKPYKEALQELRDSENAVLFKRDSWEEKMVARCRSSFSVRPNSARAVLFYSQLPNGAADPASLHGGCPVLSPQAKWAANLWVWNTPRAGFSGAPVHVDSVAANKKKKGGRGEPPVSNQHLQKHVTFENKGSDPTFEDAKLFYEDKHWGPLGEGDTPHVVNSYEGQRWHVKVKGEIKRTWVVGKNPIQNFAV